MEGLGKGPSLGFPFPQLWKGGELDHFTCSGRGRVRCHQGRVHHGAGQQYTGGQAGRAAGKAWKLRESCQRRRCSSSHHHPLILRAPAGSSGSLQHYACVPMNHPRTSGLQAPECNGRWNSSEEKLRTYSL